MPDQRHSDSDSCLREASRVGLLHAASTRDIDEQAAQLRGWNQTYDQFSPGAFNGSFAEANLGSVQLFREVTSTSLHQTGYLPAEHCAFGIPIELKGNSTFCGTSCDGSQLHVFSGRSGFEFYSPDGLDIVGVVISGDVMSQALVERECDFLPGAGEAHLRSTSARCGQQLREITLGILSVLGAAHDAADSAAMLDAMSRDLLMAVADAVSAQELHKPLRIPESKRWQIVRRVIDYTRETPDHQVTVEDLCAEARVSRRALQYCFNDTLGITPAAYLRVTRLNGARRSIKVSRSVTEAAALWGFWHFGRFAADYNAMFGELPSATFRRHHPGARALL
jgi:AraC family ethanolamine operon transcriptional activator